MTQKFWSSILNMIKTNIFLHCVRYVRPSSFHPSVGQFFDLSICPSVVYRLVRASVDLLIRWHVGAPVCRSHPSVCRRTDTSVYLSVHQNKSINPFNLLIHLSIHPICPADRLSVRPSVRPSVHPSVRPSVRPSVHPSVRSLPSR